MKRWGAWDKGGTRACNNSDYTSQCAWYREDGPYSPKRTNFSPGLNPNFNFYIDQYYED